MIRVIVRRALPAHSTQQFPMWSGGQTTWRPDMASEESWRKAAFTYRNLAGEDIKKEARERRAFKWRLGAAAMAPFVLLNAPLVRDAFAELLPLPPLPGLPSLPGLDLDLLLEANLGETCTGTATGAETATGSGTDLGTWNDTATLTATGPDGFAALEFTATASATGHEVGTGTGTGTATNGVTDTGTKTGPNTDKGDATGTDTQSGTGLNTRPGRGSGTGE